MRPDRLTAEQLRAIGTLGRSVLVSASAGTGKTTVLAQRCAYLVCEAPPPYRCDADRLLVLTFTDAAAAEMRSRITEAIRARADEQPQDPRLRDQAILMDAAQISTVHSFCLWLIRRWFSEVGIDPNATVLDADEAALIRRDVLDGLFEALYAEAGNPSEAETTERYAPDTTDPALARTLAKGFVQLIDDYGLGDDRDIARVVLRLDEFVSSLPDPDAWLNASHQAVANQPDEVLARLAVELQRELAAQADECESLLTGASSSPPVSRFYLDRVADYARQVRRWSSALVPRSSEAFETVRREIAAYSFENKNAPRLAKDVAVELREARDAARDAFKGVKEILFEKRLRDRFALFSVDEWCDGLVRTAPYVGVMVGLVKAFRTAYTERKKRMSVLDFADLERFAFQLLTDGSRGANASAVAETLQRQFAHVLVDEYQDINPLQQAIIERVCRPSETGLPSNLFVVGDVKQSIYRFRLAEPALFTNHLAALRGGASGGEAVFLQDNYRSRREILEAVNLVFRALMGRGAGDIVYDSNAELRPGRRFEESEPRLPVEVHLLDRSLGRKETEDDTQEVDERETPDEVAVTDFTRAANWTPVEREAFLMGSLIRDWVGPGHSRSPNASLRFREMVVLLRAAKFNAERVCGMFSMMGIPAYAEIGGSLLDALEVRDVLAALHILDNARQDIPLASVMRSGVLGQRFAADDFIALRCMDRDVPFHQSVRVYAERGSDPLLQERVGDLLGSIRRMRDEARCRPVADVLWDLYERHGYLAHVGGLPRGAQRHANLLRLHELARKFGGFRRQGLHRFLRFVESVIAEERTVAAATPAGEGEDVVRVMSIHHAKGLEFPVVFIAGLGTRFNLGDCNGRIIFERRSKIGLRVVDPERLIEYPSAAHVLAALEVERTAREEELRILYVAMTRARERLILVGTLQGKVEPWTFRVKGGQSKSQNVETESERRAPALDDQRGKNPAMAVQCGPGGRVSTFKVLTATTPLDWLVPALHAAPEGTVTGLAGTRGAAPTITVHQYGEDEIRDWRLADSRDDAGTAAQRAIARAQPLPRDEPRAPADAEVDDVMRRIEFVYPTLASASIRATMAAGEFKDRPIYDFSRNPEERLAIPEADAFRRPPAKYGLHGVEAGRQRGIVTHRVLQHLDFAAAVNGGLGLQLRKLTERGIVTVEEVAAVDEAGLNWFLGTPLADAIRQAGEAYRREFQFVSMEPPHLFDPNVGDLPGDYVLVRGIVDGILPCPGGVEVIDFKTDAVSGDGVSRRAEGYQGQITLYARTVSRIWRRPVVGAWLVFLTPRVIVPSGEWPAAARSATAAGSTGR